MKQTNDWQKARQETLKMLQEMEKPLPWPTKIYHFLRQHIENLLMALLILSVPLVWLFIRYLDPSYPLWRFVLFVGIGTLISRLFFRRRG